MTHTPFSYLQPTNSSVPVVARTQINLMEDLITGGASPVADDAISLGSMPSPLTTRGFGSGKSWPAQARDTTLASAIAILSASILGHAPSIAFPINRYHLLGVAGPHWMYPDETWLSDQPERLALFERIDFFTGLPIDWDGEDGVPPTRDAANAAKYFLSRLHPMNLPDECHVVGDGEIVLQWRPEGGFIEVAFDGLTISWYANSKGKEPAYGDDPYVAFCTADPRLLDAICAAT